MATYRGWWGNPRKMGATERKTLYLQCRFSEVPMTTSRRSLFGLFSLAAAGLGARAAQAAPAKLDMAALTKDTEVACLYHADFGDQARFSQLLNNINNHYSVYEADPLKLKLVVVAHSAAIKFFLEDLAGTPWEKETIDPEIYKRFVGLTKYGL